MVNDFGAGQIGVQPREPLKQFEQQWPEPPAREPQQRLAIVGGSLASGGRKRKFFALFICSRLQAD